MTRTLLLSGFILASSCAFSQLSTIAYGGNKKASVSERIALTEVTINYNRPAVRGREGKIWGTLIHEGFFKPDFGSAPATPWRAGANENTTISFSKDVRVEGKDLPAGTYGFFIAYKPDESTIIFSTNSTSWGSYYYNEKEDALRVTVKPLASDRSEEWMKFEFVPGSDSTATVQLKWEKLIIPFTVQANYVQDQLASFRKELRNEKGFNWQAYDQAAQWCAVHNVNLEEALLWADSASGPTFGGNTEFTPQATKAQILGMLGKTEQAAAAMKMALPLGKMLDLHQYARTLISLKKPKEALEVFKQNATKYPKQFTTTMGLARGYSAIGDYKTALKYALQAQPIAPDPQNKAGIEAAIEKLKEGKDIN